MRLPATPANFFVLFFLIWVWSIIIIIFFSHHCCCFFKGFTSCRSGEACVFWEPQCGTGCGHPAKAAQSSWRENNGQSTLSSRVKTSENNWNAPAAFSHFISYICYTHRVTMTDADIKNSFRFL